MFQNSISDQLGHSEGVPGKLNGFARAIALQVLSVAAICLLSASDAWALRCPVVGGDGPGGVCYPSPLIIDADGKGFHLTSAEGGVMFDIAGDGHPIQMAWTAAGSTNAFLALPHNGTITTGKELFGNYTPQTPSDHPNGFLALAVYDRPENGGNGDGVIDERDAIFSSLCLWIDSNHDGIAQPEEMHSLPELGVFSISLHYRESRREDQFGNLFRYKSRINLMDSEEEGSGPGPITYDVFFTTLDSQLEEPQPTGPKPTPTQ